MTNLKLKRDFIIKTVYTISIKTDFRIRGGILRHFSEFRLAPWRLKPLVNQTIVNFSIASRILNIWLDITHRQKSGHLFSIRKIVSAFNIPKEQTKYVLNSFIYDFVIGTIHNVGQWENNILVQRRRTRFQ